MKYFLSIIFSFIGIHSFAQEKGYADFIQADTKIQWAAWYDQLLEITPRIKKYGIRQVLYRKMQQKEKDTYVAEKNGDISTRLYHKDQPLVTDSFTSYLDPYKRYLHSNYPGNETDFITNEKNCSCSGGASTNKFDVYKIRQVLYYKHAKLYIKNILVTPLCLASVNSNNYRDSFQLTWQSSISYCYNISADSLTANQKKSCIDLGNTEQLYDLRFDIMNENGKVNPYTLDNPLFSHHIYEDIKNNKVTVVDWLNEVIPHHKVLEYGIETLKVPMYDSMGYETGMKYVRAEANIDSFYEFAINQHFFFDTTNSILYSEVNYAELYKKVITNQGIDLGKTSFYRIYFVKPSLYKKTVGKKIY